MNSEDLQKFIDRHSIQATILTLDEHTPSVSDAARALKVESQQIIKSLVFQVDGNPLLVINNGLARVDRKKLAAYLQVGRKRLKFAAPDHALEITGYEASGRGTKNRYEIATLWLYKLIRMGVYSVH